MESYRRNPNTTCSACSKPVYKRPCELRKYKSVFCSLSCYKLTVAPPKKVCQNCGKLFKPWRGTKARYCSHSCSNIARRGINYDKKVSGNVSKDRVNLLRDTFGLEHCMVKSCDYGKTYDIHRLVPGKHGGKYEIGNMFALCPNHHAEVSRGLIKFEKISANQLHIINYGG